MSESPPVPFSRRRSTRLAIGAVWALVVLLWFWRLRVTGSSPVESLQSFIDRADDVWWAIPAFIVIYALRPLILFPASVLTVAAGVLFGPYLGVAVAVVGANLSAMVAFSVGATFSPATLDALGPGTLLERWSTRLRQRSFVTVMIMRLAFLPYDLVNYASGFLRINAAAFLTATALGSFPGTVSFVLAGASVERLDGGIDGFDGRVFAASVIIFLVALGTAKLIQHREATV